LEFFLTADFATSKFSEKPVSCSAANTHTDERIMTSHNKRFGQDLLGNEKG